MALLTTMKGAPLTYSKDMQEDKEPLFDALDTASVCLDVFGGAWAGMTLNAKRMESVVDPGALATDLADYLVGKGLPFRDAHHITGALVALAEKNGCDLADLTLADMQNVDARITDDVFSVLSVENSVASRTSFGGTAPENVRAAAQSWRAALKDV